MWHSNVSSIILEDRKIKGKSLCGEKRWIIHISDFFFSLFFLFFIISGRDRMKLFRETTDESWRREPVAKYRLMVASLHRIAGYIELQGSARSDEARSDEARGDEARGDD